MLTASISLVRSELRFLGALAQHPVNGAKGNYSLPQEYQLLSPHLALLSSVELYAWQSRVKSA
jgi:hypothetical protein